tara:strand:- start:41 stop:1132 length:1092 start_codon:yes stop_codon:yes gene_type:complete
MDLFTYLSAKPKPSKKRKGKKRKRGKIKWGTPHPKTGFKSYANRPQTQMDKLLTTMTANLLQSPQDKARQTNLLQDYGSLNIGERLDERLYYAGLARPTKEQILKNDDLKQAAREGRARFRAFKEGKLDQFDAFIADTRADDEKQNFAMKRFLKENPPQEFQYDEIEEIKLGPVKEAGEYLPFSDTTPSIPEEMRDEVDSQMSFAFSDITETASDYGKKWDIIDRELNDLADTLRTNRPTMRAEALQDLRKKRTNLLIQGLEQEEFILEGLTDTNVKKRNHFIDTFRNEGNRIENFKDKLETIDNLLEIEQEAYDFDLKEAMSYSPQEAQEELNLLNREISRVEELSPPTPNLPPLSQMIFSN